MKFSSKRMRVGGCRFHLCYSSFIWCCFAFSLALSIANRSIVSALPPGFRDEGVVDDKQTVGFNFVPSILDSNANESSSSQKYMLLTTRKRGEIVAVLDPDKPNHQSQTIVILDLQDKVCSQGERGVYQVLPHPNFDQNRFVYVFYTYDKHGGCKFSSIDGPVNAVSRFRLTATGNSADTLAMVDETVIFMSNPLPSKVHNGGDMKFGNDGNLYITLGNGGMSNEHNNGQSQNTLLGSISRVTDDGSIPHDNPFQNYSTDQPCGVNGTVLPEGGRCSEIWAFGFRNPFRFALDPNTEGTETRFHINDVGGSFFEEINLLTASEGGKNYGYREREGPCRRMSNLECSPVDEYTDPIFWYEHVNRTDACMTGGAFVPNGLWPEQYDGKYLFADFIFRTISVLEEDPAQACRDCSPPIPEYTKDLFFDMSDVGQPLQMTFGPYKDSQALYYSLWGPQGQYSIRRIIYVGNNYIHEPDADDGNDAGSDKIAAESSEANSSSSGSNNDSNEVYDAIGEEDGKEKDAEDKVVNSAPDAEIRIEGQHVKKGQNFGVDEVIVFDASESWDPDGDAIVYSWNFGDGTGSTRAIQAHAYDTPGEYRVKLTVQDPHGFTNQISRLITIGKLPQPFIVYPWESLKFEVGDELELFGHAVDGDGYLLDDSNLIWEVRQIHNTHYHPFLDPTRGNMIKAPPAPSPEDFQASTNSFLRVLLTAIDPKTNLTGTIVRDVMPETKILYFSTDPPGLELNLDGFDIKTPEEEGVPLEVTTWFDHTFTINVKDQGNMIFQSWNDGTKERFSKTIIQGNPRKDAQMREVQTVKTARFVSLQQLEEGVIDIAQTGEGAEKNQLLLPEIERENSQLSPLSVRSKRFFDGSRVNRRRR
eukprot:CAMPEP_0197192430 /NCGR_PEP_ID=MMETSP1423-20130617/25051_1 /TAXON_ID=476441 /ORGANISM="Pseudo-nitzschia heimii, Strain UNC1101" /LENGTH=874 /DNA_ID=CAMNT_0042645309 /DNA_START=172 /DNA_END=2793 /DNA_ORIENTATION=+